MYQHDSPPLLDLVGSLAMYLVEVDLGGPRQDGEEEAIFGNVNGNGLAFDLQRPGPQAWQLKSLDQKQIRGRVDGHESALARDVDVKAVGQGRRRCRVGDEFEEREGRVSTG